eukprot:Gb_36190 [translate_table: standard]
MESYGNDMFLSQEGYASIDFTLLDRPSTSVTAAPESTAALLPDSSFPSFDFLDGSGVDSFGGVLRSAEEAHFHDQGRSDLQKDIEWRKEKSLHVSSTNMYIQGGGNQESKLPSSQFHMPISQVDFFSAKESGSNDLQAQLSTSGNGVGDEVHDFFEQENLSQQQPQLGRGNWSVLNNNAWNSDSNQNDQSVYLRQSTYNRESISAKKTIPVKVDIATDNGTFNHSRSCVSRSPGLNSDIVSTSMLSFMPTDTQPDDGRHSSRMAAGVRSPQTGPNTNVIKSQPRNQPLNFDSLLNGPSPGQFRANQATSASDGGTPEQHQSSAGSLAGLDTQQGHVVGQHSNSRNSSERVENMEAPVNYDFLGSQLHLKGQLQASVLHHGARQQPGLDEAQLRKQRYSYQQQLQELHRQQQVQQLEQHAKQQQAQQLEQHARQQHARHQQAQQLEQHARQQQAQQLEQHARHQQQLQQLLEKQNSGNQFYQSQFGPSMHDMSNFMRPVTMVPQMGLEGHSPSLLPGNLQRFNVGNVNWMPNGSPLMPGVPSEMLLSQDPNIPWQALAIMGTQFDPSVYASMINNLRDGAGQPLSFYPNTQGVVQELPDTSNKAASATRHQVGKPVARTVGLGASVLGEHRAISFDPASAQNEDSSGKQQALNKSLFGQNFPQPVDANHGINNLQGNTVPRRSQLQEFDANQQHKNWNENPVQKDNFQVGPSQVFGNPDVPSENVFYNSQQSGWQSVHASQAVARSDDRSQSINAGQYVQQGSYQTGCGDFLNNFASRPQGSWSALMQSAVADSSTGDAEQQDDWSGLHLQKTELVSGNSLQLCPNVKQQGIWGEQNVQASTSLSGRSFHIFSDVNASPGVHSVQGLQQTGSELGSHLGTKVESVQHTNQSKLHAGTSSQYLQEAPGQLSGWQDQSQHQRPQVGNSIQSYGNFGDRLQSSWKTHDIEQVPPESRVPSQFMSSDLRRQNTSWRHHQGNSEIESNRMFNLTSNEQSYWSKNETQESDNLLLNANQGYQKKDNDNSMPAENEQLGGFVQNGEEEKRQAVYKGDKDSATSFQHQDEKMNACQNHSSVQQEDFRTGVFSRNLNADILHAYSERYRQMPESNFLLDGSKNVILDSSAKSKGVENTSIYQQSNISHAWSSFPNSTDNAKRETYDTSRAQYSQNDILTAGQTTCKVDVQQNAKAGSDSPRNSPQRGNDLQSLSNVNPRGQSRLSKMSVGSVENSSTEMLRMPSSQMFQQPVATVSVNQWHVESSKQDSSLRGISHPDLQGHKAPEQTDLGQPKAAGIVLSNSSMHSGEDVLNTKSQTDLKERPEVGHFRDISSDYASTSSSAFDRSTSFGNLNKPTSLSSQNILELLSKRDQLNESDALKGTVCSKQDAAVELSESSASDISLAHFRRNQSSNPVSPQGFGLRLAPPSQLLQILQHGRSLQLNSSSQAAKGLNDRETCASKEDKGQVSVALATSQDISKVTEATKTDGLSRSSPVTTLAQLSSAPCELSPTNQKERTVDVMEKPLDIAPSDMHISKNQLQYLHHTSTTGQALTPQAPVPWTITQRQMQGNYVASTNQLQGSQGVAITRQLTSACNMVTSTAVSSVNAAVERASEMQGTLCETQGTFPPSNRSFSQIGYPTDSLSQDIAGQNHCSMPTNNNLSDIKNGDQVLRDSRLRSLSQLPGTSGTSQTANFSKLFNNFKTSLANQQRTPIGAEKIFPSVFESFRPSVGGSGNNAQSFLTKSDGQMKFSTGGKLAAPLHSQSYSPCIINSQQPVSAEELSKQENSFQQKASEKVGPYGISAPPSSTNALEVTMPSLPLQTSATNPQLSIFQPQGQDQRKFSMSKFHSNTPASTPYSAPCLHNQEQIKSTDGQDPHAMLRAPCTSAQQQSDSCSDGPVVSQASEPSDAPCQQYMSSDRMVSVTTMQNDSDKKAAKRLKIVDAGSSGSGSGWKGRTSEQTINPHSGLGHVKGATVTRTAQQQVSLSADARMLPSASQGSKERSEEAPSESMGTIMQNRLQNQGYNRIGYGLSQSSSAADDTSQVNSQFANTRLLQFGTNTNEQLLAMQIAAMYKRLGGSGRSAMMASQQLLPGRNVESFFPGAGFVPNITSHINETALKEAGPTLPVQNSTVAASPTIDEHAAHQHYLDKSNLSPAVTVLPKKRKKVRSQLMPWHIEITQAGVRLPTTSEAELAWASATNRLAEKEEDEIDTHEEGTGSVPRVKRRLKLTTQLMQQLITPLPGTIMGGTANVEYENATYNLAKTALGDACKLVSNLRKDAGPIRVRDAEIENSAFGQLQNSKRLKENSIVRIVEGFMDRAMNLDNELLRLEASPSMTELRSETQDLERLSIMNRLVKHHGRSLPVDPAKVTTEERESSSESSLCTRKLCPQRYVTAVPMPRNLPEGVLCISL